MKWLRGKLKDIRLLLDYRRCERETGHEQADGSAFCRCCYKMYPLNEETRQVFWRERKEK
jgi:hypothetical protein